MLSYSESKTSNKRRIDTTLAFHLAMSVQLDTLDEFLYHGIVNSYSRLKHYPIDFALLTVEVLIDKDYETKLVLAVVLEEKA